MYLRQISRGSLAIIIAVGISVLLVSCYAGLLLGYLPLTIGKVFYILRYKLLGFPSVNVSSWEINALWDLRFPRVLLAACVGMGLSLSGAVMQAVFRNPMAGPYIMGISSGAALGASIIIFLGGTIFGAYSIGIGACLGACLLSLFVILLAKQNKNKDPVYLLVFGIALSALCSGITSSLVYLNANSSGVDITLYWLMGSVAAAKLAPVLCLFALVILSTILFVTQSRILNLMLLGNDIALTLGVALKPFIKRFIFINAILTGMIVMNAGLIGFVGLIVPHFVRLAVGADHKILLPVAVLSGGCLTVWADILSRTMFIGIEIPLGVMISFIGSPLFIGMLIFQSYHRKRGKI